MEGSQWFRLGAIVALFIGSTYVLLPTIFQADPNAEKTDEIDGSIDRSKKFEREFRFRVDEGEPDAVAAALKTRIEATDLKVDDVLVKGTEVVVRRRPGVSDQDLIGQTEAAPQVRLHPLVVTLPEGDEPPTSPTGWAGLQVVKDLVAAPPSTAASELSVTTVSGSTLMTDPGFSTDSPYLIVVDDAVRGVVVPDALPDPVEGDTDMVVTVNTAKWTGLGGYAGLSADVKALPMPGVLVPITGQVTAEEAGADDTDAVVDAEQSTLLPSWVLDYLPDTRMPLGLDLQGGVDLTLQVELDEALLSQANRDLTFLEEDGKEAGLTITKARRDKYEPIIEVESPGGASAIQGFFGENMGQNYEYLESYTDSDGVQWHRFGMTAQRQEDIRSQAVEQVLDVLRKRVAETKVRDPVVVRKGGGKISVQLPGLADTKAAVSAIGRAAILEFKLVDPDFSRRELERAYRQAELALVDSPEVFGDDDLLNEWLRDNGQIPEGREIAFEYELVQDEDGSNKRNERGTMYPLVSKVVLGGQDVNGADVGFDQSQQPLVHLEFKPQGSTVFCDFTGEHVDDRFAIILDGVVQSAPTINERICGGRAQITMARTMNASEEAQALAVVLRTGSLDAPVTIGSVRQIGPSLGEAAIQAGSIATVLGGFVVLVFMAIWYRFPGLIANVALVLNIMLMLAGLSLFGWTLTLPGIAGIALTIGMAVDANIIIYERIREEIKMGQNARKAVEAGFKKAAVAVLDANITTAIAGVVLFSYGNVTIQGFAVTLLMGIGTTLLTALFVTRSLLEIVTRRATARLRI